MKYEKSYLRKKYIIQRKKLYFSEKQFNFSLIFKLIKKFFFNKKIIIASYYPSNYEVNILPFLQIANNKKFKIALPVTRSLGKMSFKPWVFNEPLFVSSFGTLEPDRKKKDVIPDIILVPLVAYDSKLNRIGYGKGYYDRILQEFSKMKKRKIFLGIAHSFQECKKIPTNQHDFKLDYIFTNKGIIESN
jgi:5-formyltetrahydrofolate cyclo-ligase